MATSKTIQLLRSSQLYVPSGTGSETRTALENAKAALTALTGRKDGEIVLARYQEANSAIKSVLGIYHANPDLPSGSVAGWTFIQDVTESEGSAAALQQELDTIESNVGLGTDGTYTSGYSNDPVVGTPATLKATVDAIVTYIKGLDVSARTNATTDGKVVVTVAQADGEISETTSDLTDVKMGGYSKTNDTGAISSSDTMEVAISKLENAIAQNTVSSNDKTVDIDDSGATTDLSVNIDGTTLVADGTSGEISSALKVIKVIPSGTAGTDEVVDSNLATNVKEAYRLVYDGSTTAIGQQINVYKDSSLKEVYLGSDTDTINASTGVITKNTVTDPQSLNFAYQLADGTYSLVKIDVSAFLTESEFGDGLEVSNAGVVSVKVGNGLEIDGTTKAVNAKVDTAANGNEFLSVSANGLKVSGVSTAITTAIEALDADLDASGTAQHGGVFVVSGVTEADGVITSLDSIEVEQAGAAAAAKATIDAYTVNGKAINTSPTLDGSDIALTGYSIAQSNAAVSATDTVNQAVGKLEKQIADVASTTSGALQSISSGNGAIAVGTEDANHDQTVSLVLDTTSANNITSDMLQITSSGLMMNDTWDCGTF